MSQCSHSTTDNHHRASIGDNNNALEQSPAPTLCCPAGLLCNDLEHLVMDPGPGCHSEAESEPDPDAEPEARAGPARVLVPWPVPIRELPEPEPGPLEPIDRETHDELVAALKEARRSAIAEGTVLNRVVYDAVHFVPAEPSRVPGGALLFESRFESGNLTPASNTCCCK